MKATAEPAITRLRIVRMCSLRRASSRWAWSRARQGSVSGMFEGNFAPLKDESRPEPGFADAYGLGVGARWSTAETLLDGRDLELLVHLDRHLSAVGLPQVRLVG
jgi:hypothetical protein